MKVGLLHEIGLSVLANIMVDQSDGDNQWHKTGLILTDDFQQLLLFISGKLPFEVSHKVLQDIGVLAYSRFEAKGIH